MARYIDADKLAKDPYMQDFYQQLAIKEEDINKRFDLEGENND